MSIRPANNNHAEKQFHRWGTGLVLAGRVIHSRFGRIDVMGKRRQVGDLFECAPDRIQVEAGATQPCTDVGQQRSAETGDERDVTEEGAGQQAGGDAA